MKIATKMHMLVVAGSLVIGLIATHICVHAQAEADPVESEQVRFKLDPRTPGDRPRVQLCQACEPVNSEPIYDASFGERPLCGVHESMPNGCKDCKEPGWKDARTIPWQAFGPGEYVGPSRFQHVPEYRLRVDDQIDFVYRLTRAELSHPYKLEVGDTFKIESINNPEINREVHVQPDGNITVLMLPPVRAARRTLLEVKKDLEEKYTIVLRKPSLTLSPVKVGTRLEDLRASVDNRFGSGGQGINTRVMPDGMIRLPAIGSVPAQGLTLDELKLEVDERYHDVVAGIEVTPILQQRANRFVYVLGEVRTPGKFTLDQPTSVLMALAMAGHSTIGGNNREVVVFRRADDWKLMATRLDLNGAILGKKPSPSDEIWLRDSDVIVVPKSALWRLDNFIELAFTRGIYAIAPANTFFVQKNTFSGN